MDKQGKLKACASLLIDVIPQTRGSINAHIVQKIDQSQWVTPGQSRVLYLIDQEVDNVSDLAIRQKISAPTVSRQINSMVEKGLILRKPKKSDRRVVVLRLTAKGKEILDGGLTTALFPKICLQK